MILYHLHDMQHAALAPFRMAAEATHAAFRNPFMPEEARNSPFGRSMAAGAELFERTTRRFGKPAFGIHSIRQGRDEVKVTEEVAVTKPFCRLLHFKRDTSRNDPKVLLVAPMSGHHATLLRGTVEALLQEHDVYITDWIDAKTGAAEPRQVRSGRLHYLCHGFHPPSGAGSASNGRMPADGSCAGRRGVARAT